MIENKRTEPRIADTIHTDSFKALGFNPIRQVTDRSDIELYNSDMGMAMADRVAVRDFYRLRYGNGFRVQHGRDMNDGEVDGAIRQTYGIDSENIDYTAIKQKQQKELQFYTGDYENLEAKEWLSGTLGAIFEGAEGVVEEGGRFLTAALSSPYFVGGSMGGGALDAALQARVTEDEANQVRETANVISSKIDEFVNFLPEEMRGDLEELRARAGDADALSISAAFAAFLSNAPNFAAGYMPAWAGLSFMYAQEKKHSLEAFEDIFDVPRMLPTKEEFKGNDNEYSELLTRYNVAHTYASLYAAVSGGIEYFQTKGFKKLAGLKGETIQREFTRTMLSQIKKVLPEAAFNVGEELSQQLVYNQVFNAAVKKAKDFGIEKEKVAWNDGLYDSALGSARISAILAPVGISVRGVRARNYVRQTEQGLIDSGFSKAMAREYARKMADAAGDPEQFRAITEEINGVYETIDIASKAKIEEKKAAQIYDETGRITMGGEILTDADFDQMATIYNEQELRDLIRNVTEKDLFVEAVYGNTEARRDYNKLILDVVDEALETEFPDEEEPEEQVDRKPFTVAGVELDQEYDINGDTEVVINKIINGDFDDSLEVAEGQTIEEARQAAVKQTIEKYGTPIEQKVNEATDDVDQTSETEGRKPKVNKNKKRRLEKERKKMVERAEKALRVVAPGVKVVLIDNSDDFIRRTGAVGNGYYDMKNTIFLNGDSATQGTVAHEVVHAVFHQKFKNTENIRIAADRILNQMLKHSLSAKTRAEIVAFQQRYINLSARLLEEGDAASSERVLKELDEEGIAQLASILLNNYDALKPTLRSQIQDFLATIFKGVVSFSDEGRAIEMLRVLAYKTTAGERILEDDLALLNEMAAEMPEGYESQGETQFRADKFQLSYYDEESNLSYFYDMDSQQWDELEEKGFITRDRSIRNFNGMTIMLHQPDAFFSGSIERNGQVLVSGAGGVFYPLKFNDQGYFWASTKGGASQIVNTLNKVAKANGGTILMGLTSAPRGKEFGSTKGANAVLDLFRSLAQDSQYDFTLTELNKIAKKASRHLDLNTSGLKTLRRKFGALNSSFEARAEFTKEVIREVGKLAQSKPEFNKQLLAFYKSIKIYDRPLADIKEGQTKKEKTAEQIAKGQKGDLGTLGLRHIAEMLAEPVLKNAVEGEPTMQRKSGGELYAVLEINGPLKLVETYEHESYPFAVASEDGNKPVIHMLKDRYMWDTAVINPNTGKQIRGRSKSKLYPPTAGISKPFTVQTQGKAQLSSDYALNFDRIPQVVQAIKRYFAGEITYDQFIDIQQKFDPIRRFETLPQLPSAKEMKDVLKKDQAPLVNKKPKEGEVVGLRLDIPAYTKKDAEGNSIGKYVVTMHAKGGKAIAYTATARAKNVRMVSPTATVAKIAIGKIAKTSVSVMQGEYIDTTDQQNYELAEQLMTDPNWTQIGYNPFRRSFFYVREGKDIGMPVLGAEEVVQIGGLVFAKNAEVVTPDHPKFRLQKPAQKEALGILRDDGKFQLTEVEDAPKKKIKIATFFSGLGTVELALLDAMGFEVVSTAEIEQGIVDTYNLTHGTAEIPTDILKLKVQELVDKGVQFIHMSPPCQAFSYAREKGKVTEEDFKLEMKIARKLAKIIAEVQPDNITIENAPAYQDSAQYAVIRKALGKAGYYIEESTPDAQNYGGNSMRTRLIVRASKTPLPDMPKEHRDGDWFPAIAKFIPEAPVDETIQFEGRSGINMKIVQDLLGKIYDHTFDPNVAYIAPGGDGIFKPQGGAGNALTANFVYDEKKRKAGIKEKKKLEDGSLYGSAAVMRIALPVRKMVKEKGLKYTAKYYGATVKQVKDAYENMGFLVKRGTTEMYLAYMNLPTDATMSDNVQLNRAMLGNGIQGVITREFIAPMIGKAQLADDFLERQIELARQEREEAERKQLEREREILEEPEDFDDDEVSADLDDPDEFYDEFVDEDQLFDDERIEGTTKLTKKEIKILLMNMGEVLSSPRGKRFATLIANAAKDCNPIDVKNLALQALEEDLILNDQQHAMFVYRVTQLRNEIEELRDAMENAQYGNTSVDLSRKYEDKLAEMSLLVKADAKSGSATGRALNARRIALNNDYSLASVIRRASAAKSRLGNSGDLTPEEQKNLADVQAKWEKTQAKIIEYQNKQYTTVRDTDIKAGNLFIKKAQSDRGTKAAKKSLNQKDKLIKRLKNKGYNIEGFGKSQLFNISPSLAIDIREMAKVLVYEGYNDLDSVVNEIKNVLPDTLEYDIYGAISGRVQRIPKTETEARKTLKALTLQSDLIVQINNAMDNLFDPERVQAPKSVEVQALRAKLEELKKASRESAREDAAAARMLAEINNIELMIEGLYRPVRKPSKKQSERISDMADRLFTKRAELRAQDKLILLRTIIDYGEPPKFARTKRNPQSRRLEEYRAEIALLEAQIKETRRIKADEARKARLEAEQKARLDELTSQVAGWYRANVAPKQQAKLNDVQVSIKEKQRLLKQQDRIAELTEILETGRLPEKDAPQIKTETEYTEVINELQEQIRQQEWYQQMQQVKFEEKRKANVLAKIEEQERIVREKDFATYLTPKEKKEILDPELKDLLIVQRENERLIRRAINDLKPKTTLERVADYISLPRAFMATADMSAVFRQAFLLGVRHPVKFAKAVRTSAKAMFDPQFASQVMTILDNDEMSLIRQGAGLFFSSLDTGLLTSEEAFSSAALEQVYKIPGVGRPISAVMGASERHMVIMLNVMRAASFDAFVEANPNATELELKSMAHYINTASGRGDLYALEGASTALSAFFFSPRFAMSRLMVGLEGGAKISKGFLKGEERIVAEEIARQWGAALTTWAIVGTLAVLAGAEIGDDPEESDFGLIKMGRTRLDFFAGMGPMMRLLSKFGDSAIKRISGEEVKVDLSTQVLNTFFKYKASPWIGTTIELFTGKRYVTRQDVSPLTTIVEKAFPISLVNLYQGIQEEHSFQEIATEFSGEFVGLGVQTRKPKKKKSTKKRRRVTY